MEKDEKLLHYPIHLLFVLDLTTLCPKGYERANDYLRSIYPISFLWLVLSMAAHHSCMTHLKTLSMQACYFNTDREQNKHRENQIG